MKELDRNQIALEILKAMIANPNNSGKATDNEFVCRAFEIAGIFIAQANLKEEQKDGK